MALAAIFRVKNDAFIERLRAAIQDNKAIQAILKKIG